MAIQILPSIIHTSGKGLWVSIQQLKGSECLDQIGISEIHILYSLEQNAANLVDVKYFTIQN